MSLKRARDGPITADAGQDEAAEHAAGVLVRLSATVHSENEAGRTHSEYEWEKTAKGFKRRRIGTQEWTVSFLHVLISRRSTLTWHVFLSMACAATRGCGMTAKTAAAPRGASISESGRSARSAAAPRDASISGCGRDARTAPMLV